MHPLITAGQASQRSPLSTWKVARSTSMIRRSRTVSLSACESPADALLIPSALTKKTRIRGQEYFLKLVDTAGQDEYSIFPAQYTMDVDGFCLVYRWVARFLLLPLILPLRLVSSCFPVSPAFVSINNRKSFDVVKTLYDKLLDLTGKVQ